MPNGDEYMVEPYSRQQNLTGNNFAFRDYYKGAVCYEILALPESSFCFSGTKRIETFDFPAIWEVNYGH
jgi:hypothetical protein